MSGNDWIHTRRGVTLVEGTLPKLARGIEALTEEVKRLNDGREEASKLDYAQDDLVDVAARTLGKVVGITMPQDAPPRAVIGAVVAEAASRLEQATELSFGGPKGAEAVVRVVRTEHGLKVYVTWPGGKGPFGEEQRAVDVEAVEVSWNNMRPCQHKGLKDAKTGTICIDCGTDLSHEIPAVQAWGREGEEE